MAHHPSPSAFLTAPSPSTFINPPTPAQQPPPPVGTVGAAFSPSAAPPYPSGASPAAAAGSTSFSRPSPLPTAATLAALPPPRGPLSTRPGAAPTVASTRTGLTVEDPTVEATRAVGILLGGSGAAGGTAGAGRAEGLLDRVEKEVEELLGAYERAFENGGGAGVVFSPSLPSLRSLLSLLSRSSLGGYIPPLSPSSSTGLPPPTLSQAHIDAASARVGELFKEVQRIREGGEVGRVGLMG